MGKKRGEAEKNILTVNGYLAKWQNTQQSIEVKIAKY